MATDTADSKFEMTLDLNILNHLGINLYSNTPAVLAEAVANAWDADAENVRIDISKEDGTISISDDGHGMSVSDMNEKFLRVGYKRRVNEAKTPKFGRAVMGRKGIGKLSLFSIADTIQVQSRTDSGEINGFIMSLPNIKEAIQGSEKSSVYHPEPIPQKDIVVEKGSRLILSNIRKGLNQAEAALRRRLARRFSVIDSQNKFTVSVNGEPITVKDRDYYSRLQYVWHFGEEGQRCRDLFENAEHTKKRKRKYLNGWIGTVKESGQLRDGGESMNKIVVMIRGKLAQEDLLEVFGESGLYTKFVIGEIHADFLDEDAEDDIATTSRQAIIEDDPRFVKLKEAVRKELKHIQNQWTSLRNKDAEKVAREIPPISKWFGELGRDDKRRAQAVFGKINQVAVDTPDQRAMLFKYGVLAFENLKAKQNLDALKDVTGENIIEFGRAFGYLDDLEASLYYQIVKGRVDVVRALREQIDDDKKERVIQEHLFNHLWLLDPSWERATATEFMESRVVDEFAKVDAKLTSRERKGRVDIKYRTTAGKHVIVELKRASVVTNTNELLKQVGLYRNALRKILHNIDPNDSPQIDIVCVVGRKLRDWSEYDGKNNSEVVLKTQSARVVLYDQLINAAYKAYKEFLDKGQEAGRIVRLLGDIDETLDA